MEKLRDRLARRLRSLMDDNPSLDTQVKVSKKAGVSQSTVQRVLSREVGATLDVLEDLGRAFGVRPASLLLDEGETELLRVWSSLNELDRSEVLRFEHVLAQRSTRFPNPRLDMALVKETPDLEAATLRASSRPPANGPAKTSRQRRRESP